MAVGQPRGLGAARVDHHQGAAAPAQLGQPPLDARRGHQAAVGGHRVGAQHQQEVGAVDVGHRQQQLMAEHLERRQVVRQLVDRGGRVAVAGAQRAQQRRAVEQHPEVVHVGIAQIDRQGVASVAPANGAQPRGGLVERLAPADLGPPRAPAAQRPAQPVGVVLDVLQGDRLGTDVAAAERIVPVAADGHDPLAGELDLDAADRLAQVAGAVVPVRARRAHERENGQILACPPGAARAPGCCRRPASTAASTSPQSTPLSGPAGRRSPRPRRAPRFWSPGSRGSGRDGPTGPFSPSR